MAFNRDQKLANDPADKKYSETELSYLPASELLPLFKTKKLSPVTVLKAQIARIEKLNSKLTTITATHFEEALEQAKESEKRYQQGTQRALEGITCAIKDEVDVKGWRTTMGTSSRNDAPIAEEDADLTTFLREAGVVMHIQTTVPEYYCNLVTWGDFGVCRNPWNLEYTPGGSSGGSAAALSAGFTTLATGSDMGGSIRFPAAMSGLYGFKPPYGRVASSYVRHESEGPMARTFEDMCLFQNAIHGPAPLMSSTLKEKINYLAEYKSIAGVKIAYDSMEQWGIPLDETVKKSMQEAVQALRKAGATVVEMDLGLRAKDFETYALGIFSTSIGAFCFADIAENPSNNTPYIKFLFENYYKKASPVHLQTSETLMLAYHKTLNKKVFSQGFTAIIMPTMCSPYVKADMGKTPDKTNITINGKLYPAEQWNYSFTWPWNMLGEYPVVNVPIGLTPESIPLGMQIIGNAFEDLNVFQVACAWSKLAPRFFQDKKPLIASEEKTENTVKNKNGK